MAKAIETVATINSAIRTLLALLVCGAIGTGGYFAYDTYHAKENAAKNAERQLKAATEDLEKAKENIETQRLEIAHQSETIAQQVADLKKKDEQIEKLEIARRLLK